MKLIWTGSKFTRSESGNASVFLLLDNEKKAWEFHWTSEAGFVDRRTAQRQADHISRSGIEINGIRYGSGYELVIKGEDKPPERLLHDQHKY